jgi:hypothetical protein
MQLNQTPANCDTIRFAIRALIQRSIASGGRICLEGVSK